MDVKKRKNIMKIKNVVIILITAALMAGCNDARVASTNLSTAADNFEINRRVVFYNGITGEYMLVIEGYSSIKFDAVDNQLELTVKTGPSEFKKHFLGLSHNVTYFAEQINSNTVDAYHYRVIFKPKAIIPNIEFK